MILGKTLNTVLIKFLKSLFKEISIVILLRRKVEPKYSSTDF